MSQGVNGDRGGSDSGTTTVSSGPAGRGFFDPIKPQQGKRVRGGSAAVAAVLIIWGGQFMFEFLKDGTGFRLPVAIVYGLPVLWILGTGLCAYHFLARSAKTVDFLIATDGEMNKVHWSTRKEITGSTKVVIFVMVAMAVILFLVDMIFMVFFTEIGVLRLGEGVLQKLFGGGG